MHSTPWNAGSFFLTGERRSHDTAEGVLTAIKPERGLNPSQGGWGAWELAARYSHINLNSHGVNGGKEGNLSLGLNWYPHSNLQFRFNYIRAFITDRNSPTVNDGRAGIYHGRFQIAF